MSDSDLGGPNPTPGLPRTPAAGLARAASAARTEKRVALGDLTNFVAGGRSGAADAENVDKVRKLKPSLLDIEILKGRLLEEQQRRERAETQLSRLKGVEARAQKLELQLAACTAFPGDKLDGSSCVSMPRQLADLEKQALTNLNKAGEANLTTERAENAADEFAVVGKEKDRPIGDHAMLPEQDPRDGDSTSLKDVASRMDGKLRELESIIDTMNEIVTQQDNKLGMMNERLRIKEREVTSLEQERDQLCSQVATLKLKVGISELGYGDNSVSSTEVPSILNTPALDSEAKPEKTAEWLRAVEELKGQAGSVKKQPVLIEICDDEEISMWYDDNAPLNPSSSGEPGGASFQQKGSCEWFFRGNKLMFSSSMKKHLKEICGCVLPEIPFFLYQMNKSNLKPNGRMRLSAKYTAHLLSFLKKREGPARLEVDDEDWRTVRINLLRDGRASLSPDWQVAIEAKNIKVGDICAFHFKVCDGDLKLAIHTFHVVRYLVNKSPLRGELEVNGIKFAFV